MQRLRAHAHETDSSSGSMSAAVHLLEDDRGSGAWCSVVHRADGSAAVVVGEVHAGDDRAATAELLAVSSDTLARTAPCPHELLWHLRQIADQLEVPATSAVAVLVDDDGARLASAGHVPALVVSIDGAIRVVHGSERGMLSDRPAVRPRPPITRLALEDGGLLALMAVGVAGPRRPSMIHALERCADAAVALRSGPLVPVAAELCSAAMHEFGGSALAAVLRRTADL